MPDMFPDPQDDVIARRVRVIPTAGTDPTDPTHRVFPMVRVMIEGTANDSGDEASTSFAVPAQLVGHIAAQLLEQAQVAIVASRGMSN